jgi:hypothetical protein
MGRYSEHQAFEELRRKADEKAAISQRFSQMMLNQEHFKKHGQGLNPPPVPQAPLALRFFRKMVGFAKCDR